MSNKSERTEIELMKQEITMIKETNEKDHRVILNEVTCLRKDFKDFIQKAEVVHEQMRKEAEQKFASKTTEKVVYSIIGAIGLAVLYALLREIGLN